MVIVKSRFSFISSPLFPHPFTCGIYKKRPYISIDRTCRYGWNIAPSLNVFFCYVPLAFSIIKLRPNEYNISYNIIQLWCFMKCCTRLTTLWYCVLLCCILLYEVWSRSNFSLNKCCTIQHFFCFPRCCMMLHSFGHPMQLCCTLLYSRVRSRSNFAATFLCWLCFQRHV